MTDMPDTTSAFDPSHTTSHERGRSTTPPATTSRATRSRTPRRRAARIDERWGTRQFEARIANPANRRRLSVIVVGTGLAGASAAATLGEAGYVVKSFCYQDSPRRAHSIAAQGGINAAKNYKGDGDSVYRLFYDTIKGGDYRSRESNVYRLAQVSVNIIDQCVAQGVPFAREYGGLLDNRSFGGVQVSRTFYARGQTGQQLLIGAYQALERQVAAGTVQRYTRHEMVELIVVDGRARGIIVRDMVTGEIETYFADVVVLASGGYGNVFFLSTNAMGCNVTATWRAHRKGAYMANPCYTQIHPTCIPVSGAHQSKLTLMSESLRNDGRIWVPKNKADCDKNPRDIPEEDRDYYLERIYPSFGNLVPRDIASRQAKNMCDEGRGVGPEVDGVRRGVYLDFAEAIERLGREAIEDKYGNLFDMYARITGEDPYEVPMRIYPAVHYVMGGLWVDYDLQSTIPGLFVTGEANFSDHGANRLGASALMQGLADGYFVLPNTIRDYLADGPFDKVPEDHPAVVEAQQSVQQRIDHFMNNNGTRSVDSYHRELGNIMWEFCGMERTEDGLKKAIDLIRTLKDDFWRNVKVLGTADSLNQSLEQAGRVADFLELGELMCIDALNRRESCGGHFRAESQTEDGEALRHDDQYSYVAAWEWAGEGREAGPAQGEPGLRVRRDEAEELQVMRLTLKIWRQADAAHRRPDAHLRRRRRLPRHVVPRDARRAQRAAERRGRGAGRLRLRLPRGHLRHVRADDQRRGRTAPRSPPPASCTCGRSRTARRSPSSPGAPTPSRCSRTSAWTAAPSTGSSSRAATSRSTPAPPPTPTPPRSRRTRRTVPSTPPPASAAAPASPPAPTARRRCSSAPRSPTSASCRRARPSATAGWSTWSPSTTTRASAAAPTSASAPRPAPRRSRST